jgi:hypothetical protein|tara:strand:- start:302 stop:589 length:288 start_codon:yes stop_codon:yes gene_type:complete
MNKAVQDHIKLNVDSFYKEITNLVEGSVLEVSPTGRVVALFRVAVEYGAVQIGLPTLAYLMSRILTITLGIATGDEEAAYDNILEEFETDGEMKH